jgi:hypothetical protein
MNAYAPSHSPQTPAASACSLALALLLGACASTADLDDTRRVALECQRELKELRAAHGTLQRAGATNTEALGALHRYLQVVEGRVAALGQAHEVMRSAAVRDEAARRAALDLEHYVRGLEVELRQLRLVVDRIEIVSVEVPGASPMEGVRVKALPMHTNAQGTAR